MKTIKQMSEEYARKAHFASGVNPNLIESVVFEALIEFKNLQQPHAESHTNNLIEFIAEEEEIDNLSAKIWIEELMKNVIENPLHYGDCVKQNVSCNMCLLEGILNDYSNKIK